MRNSNSSSPRFRARLVRFARRFSADTRGVTMVEFALVSIPFLVMMLGIMTIGLYYLTNHSLQRGVLDASRLLRTGEAQKAGMTLNDFRNLVCEKSGDLIACDTHLVIHVESNALFANLNPPTPCLTDGKLTPRQGSGSDGIRSRSGDASMAVVVTACYDWQGGMPLFQFIWNLLAERGETPREQNMVVLSAATAFRSEPFE